MRPLALLALLLPASALACPDALRSAADEATAGGGVSPTAIRAVLTACGDAGPASLVAELVARGACDTAAQLGRSFGDRPGLPGAVTAADACLAGRLQAQLGALDDLASEPDAEDASERREFGAKSRSAPVAPRADQAPPASAPADSGIYYGPEAAGTLGDADRYGGLAGTGAGKGGGGRARAYGGEIGGYAEGAAAPSGSARSNEGVLASTGSGRLVPSPVGERLAASGRPVAWTRLSLGVWFDVDSASLRPEALETITTLASYVRSMDGATTLEVVGHTDSTGAWAHNADLSARRALSVRQALQLAGIPGDRLAVRGAGEDEPVADNYSPWGRAQNRRVEFRFWKPVDNRQVTR